MAFSDGVGANSRADGDVRYRVTEHGSRVGILPATCKRRLHSLAVTGYSHVVSDEEQLLRLTCPACLAEPHPDHTWRLRMMPPPPDAAELDDDAYRDVVPQFQAVPVAGAGPRRAPESESQQLSSPSIGSTNRP